MIPIKLSESNKDLGSLRYRTLYHLTNDPNFSVQKGMQQKQQEMGSGLYLTTLENVTEWDQLLRKRDYVVSVDVSDLYIVDAKDFPSEREMAQDIKDAGFGASDVKKYLPTGDTFGQRPMKIATQIMWALEQRYDAIKPPLDPEEGEQVVVYNTDKVRVLEITPFEDFVKEKGLR